jgi:hypothetical protein
MLTGLLSFLGGSAFRMLWGEVSSLFDKHLEHNQELDRMKLIEQFDEAKHRREMESLKLQAEHGVQLVRVKSEANIDEYEAKAWAALSESTTKQIGIKWVDAWNAAIRPGGATWAIALLTLEAFAFVSVTSGTLEVAWAFLGLFVADRTLGKRGK